MEIYSSWEHSLVQLLVLPAYTHLQIDLMCSQDQARLCQLMNFSWIENCRCHQVTAILHGATKIMEKHHIYVMLGTE